MQQSHEKIYKYKSADFNNDLEANLGHNTLLQIHMKFTMVKLIAGSRCRQTNLTTKCEKTNQQN